MLVIWFLCLEQTFHFIFTYNSSSLSNLQIFNQSSWLSSSIIILMIIIWIALWELAFVQPPQKCHMKFSNQTCLVADLLYMVIAHKINHFRTIMKRFESWRTSCQTVFTCGMCAAEHANKKINRYCLHVWFSAPSVSIGIIMVPWRTCVN